MGEQVSGERGREGLFSALKNIGATLLSIGKTRAELLVTEVEEEKIRLITLGAKALGATLMLTAGIVMLMCCLVLAFWEQRVLLFGMFAIVLIGGALLLQRSVKQQLHQPSSLFRASLAELEADMVLLRQPAKKPE